MPNCAECSKKPCRSGSIENVPSNCPGLTHTPEEVFSLYSEEERFAARQSALVEAEGYCVNTRLEETMDYAYKMGYRHLGVAFCVGLSEEAQILCKVLRANGFVVDSVCCKNCRISKEKIGITREEQVRPYNDYEGMCNPAGQAMILDEAGVDLAILLGLCVGHDTLFFKHIKAPCTVLSSKDRAMGNNPMAAIYTAGNYMGRQMNFIERKYGKEKEED